MGFFQDVPVAVEYQEKRREEYPRGTIDTICPLHSQQEAEGSPYAG